MGCRTSHLTPVAMLVLVLATAQCTPRPDADPTPVPDPATPTSSTSEGLALPPTTGVLDYQLDGQYDSVTIDGQEQPITVVVRDATAAPLQGAYSICYVNGFQTQPEDAAMWLQHPELLLQDAAGAPVTDPDWPGEYVLDPSTPQQREGILRILAPQVTGCRGSGFDAVEIDNLDTFTRFPAIDRAGVLALASAYVATAHEEGLAIGQKNTAELGSTGHDAIGFDFAITEECAAWDECEAYDSVYGPHVLQIEYPDALEQAGITFADACADPARAPLTILRDRYLQEDGSPEHVYETC